MKRILLGLVGCFLLCACTQDNSSGSGSAQNALNVRLSHQALNEGTTAAARSYLQQAMGSELDVTAQTQWQSLTPEIASIDADGTISAQSRGKAFFSAQVNEQQATAQLDITDKSPVALTLSDTADELIMGIHHPLRLFVVFDDGTKQNITRDATWRSLDKQIVTVDRGVLIPLAEGQAEIVAEHGGFTLQIPVNVRDASLLNGATLSIESPDEAIAEHIPIALRALLTLTDGDVLDVTKQVHWISEDSDNLQFVKGPGRKGWVYAQNTNPSNVVAVLQAEGIDKVAEFTLKAEAKRLVGIKMRLSDTEFYPGKRLRLASIASFADGSELDVTPSTHWYSDNLEVVTVLNAGTRIGQAEIMGMGDARILARFQGYESTQQFSIQQTDTFELISPVESVSVLAGETETLQLFASYSDGRTLDITADAAWYAEQPDIVRASSGANTSGEVLGVGSGSTRVKALFLGKEFQWQVDVDSVPSTVTALSIAIDPESLSLNASESQTLSVRAQLSNDTTANVTADVTWHSADTGIVRITNGAVAEAVGEGETTITASYQALSTSINAQVAEAPVVLDQLRISTNTTDVAKGDAHQLTMAAIYSNAIEEDITTQAVWQSDSPAVAEISEQGVVTASSVGQAQITGAYSGLSKTIAITVTPAEVRGIYILPQSPTTPIGLEESFKATAIYSDDSTQDVTSAVAWSSSETAYASIDLTGNGIALMEGTTVVSASLEGHTATQNWAITPVELIELRMVNDRIRLPLDLVIHSAAIAFYSDQTTADITQTAQWIAFDPGVVRASHGDGSRGRIRGLLEGSADVVINHEDLFDLVNFTVTDGVIDRLIIEPADVTIVRHADIQLRAYGVFTDGSLVDLTDNVTWTEDDDYYVRVSGSGFLNGRHAGSTTVSASYDTVTATINAASVDPLISEILVSPFEKELIAGQQIQMYATAHYAGDLSFDVTHSADWTSSDTDVISVDTGADHRGVATAVAAGSATITAEYQGEVFSTNLTVVSAEPESIEIQPASNSIALGLPAQYTAIAHYDNGASVDVTADATWCAVDKSLARMTSSAGLLTFGLGDTAVDAKFQGHKGESPLTVVGETIQSLSIIPANGSFNLDRPVSFTAQVTTSGGNVVDVTEHVLWESSDPAVLAIANGDDSGEGLTHSAGSGSLTVSLEAAAGSLSASTSFTVTNSGISAINLSMDQSDVGVGDIAQLTATATYADGHQQDITQRVVWQISDVNLAYLGDSRIDKGWLKARGAGQVTVNATFAGIIGTLVIDID